MWYTRTVAPLQLLWSLGPQNLLHTMLITQFAVPLWLINQHRKWVDSIVLDGIGVLVARRFHNKFSAYEIQLQQHFPLISVGAACLVDNQWTAKNHPLQSGPETDAVYEMQNSVTVRLLSADQAVLALNATCTPQSLPSMSFSVWWYAPNRTQSKRLLGTILHS